MNQKKKTGLLAVLAFVIILGGMLSTDTVIKAWMKPEGSFSIEAEILPTDRETYDVKLTIENQGEDWEGTVRLFVDEDYRTPTAYDTVLSLPQGSKKQFVVKVPVHTVNYTNGTVVITLLNRKGEETAKKEFKRLLVDQMESLSMGILSDAYSQLTYLDMGGAEIYFYNALYPIKLVQLQQGNLEDVLDSLTFLVIDQYHTDILTPEEIKAIELWNMAGGVLIIGTGEYAEDTLKGFNGSYLKLGYTTIQKPAKDSNLGKTDSEQTDTDIADSEQTDFEQSDFEQSDEDEQYDDKQYDDMQGYDMGGYVDWSRLTMAQLYGMSGMYADYYTGAYVESMVSGSVTVLPYSLTQLGSMDDSFWYYGYNAQEEFVMQLLENASSSASARYTSSSYYDSYSSYTGRFLGTLGSSNSILNFGVLKAIVIIYVVFVGPLLYLILRLMKRRELYWAAVPVTALLAIVLVFLAGRGFEVVNTRVYSVTVKNLAEGGKNATYLHCYDADHKEWDLKLAEECEYAGPLEYSYYYGGLNDKDYFYHVKREGDDTFIGIAPSSNFEDSYFYVRNLADKYHVEGKLTAVDVSLDWTGISGTVVNETDRDMDNFAVILNDSVYVFGSLPAGAAFNLQDEEPLFGASGGFYSTYIYNFLEDFYDNKEYDKAGIFSALGVGICDVYPQSDPNAFIVIGIMKDWDKTIDDNCSEISYGCLYSIQ